MMLMSFWNRVGVILASWALPGRSWSASGRFAFQRWLLGAAFFFQASSEDGFQDCSQDGCRKRSAEPRTLNVEAFGCHFEHMLKVIFVQLSLEIE